MTMTMEKAAIWLKVIEETCWGKRLLKDTGSPVRTTGGGATHGPGQGSCKAAPTFARIGGMLANPETAFHFPVLICDSRIAKCRAPPKPPFHQLNPNGMPYAERGIRIPR
jgi:hypothetical protein